MSWNDPKRRKKKPKRAKKLWPNFIKKLIKIWEKGPKDVDGYVAMPAAVAVALSQKMGMYHSGAETSPDVNRKASVYQDYIRKTATKMGYSIVVAGRWNYRFKVEDRSILLDPELFDAMDL